MGFLLDELFTNKINKTYSSSYSDQRQIDQSKKINKTITNTSTVTDARSVILTINSPNATTKKSDKTVPTVETPISPTLTSPTSFGSPTNQPTFSTDQGSGSTASGLMDYVFLGLMGVGGFVLVNNAIKGGNK